MHLGAPQVCILVRGDPAQRHILSEPCLYRYIVQLYVFKLLRHVRARGLRTCLTELYFATAKVRLGNPELGRSADEA